MKQIALMVRKEWISFVRSDRSLFIVYAVIVVSWGMLIANWKDTGTPSIFPLWLAMFSVIVAATFANTVFVSERVSGSLEILLTCGISRSAILFGKIAFVFGMTILVGALCVGFACVIKSLVSADHEGVSTLVNGTGIVVYSAASFLNAAASAYFSVVLPNPRALHLINLVLISGIMTLHLLFAGLSLFLIAAIIGILGALFMLLAKKEFNGERIIKPVVL
jgi:ABC-type Na+ efflux pump permease subunit